MISSSGFNFSPMRHLEPSPEDDVAPPSGGSRPASPIPIASRRRPARAGTTAGGPADAPHVVLIRRGINVTVEDVDDAALTSEIDSAVRQALRHLSGKWDVALRRSPERHQWDLRLHGASGRHLASFASPAQHLPWRIADKLHAFLDYIRRTSRAGQ